MSNWRLKFARRRWLFLLALLPLIAAGLYLADRVDSASDVGRARRFFRDSFQAGVMTERMAGELDRMSTPLAVAALTRLLREENSRFAAAYESIWGGLPKGLQRHLPTPVNRTTVLLRSVQMLERFRGEAAPAVGELVRLYQSSDPRKSMLRSVVVSTLARIGPPAREAIPVLLPGLDPTNGSMQSAVAETLAQIDPSGDFIDRSWATLEGQHSGLTSNIAMNCVAVLTPASPGVFPNRFISQWTAIQVLGLVRVETPRSLGVLGRQLRDPRERVRGAAVVALGRLGPAAREAAPDLRLLLTDEWLMVREAATNALRAMSAPLSGD